MDDPIGGMTEYLPTYVTYAMMYTSYADERPAVEFTVTLTGRFPLLLHNARLADPLDPITREMKRANGKRTKTDDDYEKVARLEFAGSLYMDPDIGPYLPGENIQRCLVDAGRMSKLGVKVTRGVFIDTDVNPLSYPGPRTVDDLWADEQFRHRASVKIGVQRVMRCRPIFRQWKVQAHGLLDESQLNFEDLAGIAESAGMFIGLGDWRPRFGRFAALVEKV